MIRKLFIAALTEAVSVCLWFSYFFIECKKKALDMYKIFTFQIIKQAIRVKEYLFTYIQFTNPVYEALVQQRITKLFVKLTY